MSMSFIAGHTNGLFFFLQGTLRISKLFEVSLCRNTGLLVVS